jgi:hypothetical protein
MSQLTKTVQSGSIGAQLVDAGLDTDTDEFAAASAMTLSGASIDEAVAKYGGGGGGSSSSAIATQKPSGTAMQKKGKRGAVQQPTEVVVETLPAVKGSSTEATAEVGWNLGVTAAHKAGTVFREEALAGFKTQSALEATMNEQFLGQLDEASATMFREA